MIETLKIEAEIDYRLDIIIDSFNAETERETVINRLDAECNLAWGALVMYGRIDEYTVADLIGTAKNCVEIIVLISN